ncbi:MAG TPA: four-helix bundle copper-binding protein [Brumimicrobium sp.]|nr:four-helix bundle copper-binding protein [Brumimicrobium sp.]
MRNKQLISALENCIIHCNHCADACLDEKNVSHMVDCIRTDRVCAEICTALKNILSISYTNVGGLVEYCQQICRECADECGSHEAQHCKDCAEACRKCEQACREYLA